MRLKNFLLRFFGLQNLVLVSILFISAMGVASAQEEIKSFHSKIEIQEDASLIVSEFIDVVALGQEIKRGIYRDFPLNFTVDGQKRRVGFEILSISRNGKSEDYHTENIDGGIRIYLGNANVFLDHGSHEYQITYRTTRQIRFFEQHEELFWNVTGNFWNFPIQKASAEIYAAPGAPFEGLTYFTGTIGSESANAQGRIQQSGKRAVVQTTGSLPRGHGLSVAVKWQLGVLPGPTSGQKQLWFFQDHSVLIAGLIGSILAFFFHYSAWRQHGVDPDTGPIAPQWRLPKSISPAMVNYIDNKGLGQHPFKAISAAFISLAVKGFVTIDVSEDVWKIRTVGEKQRVDQKDEAHKLPVGESYLLGQLERRSSGQLVFDGTESSEISQIVSGFRTSMETEHRDVYYKHNRGKLVAGIFFSVATIVLMFVLASYYNPEMLEIGITSGVIAVFGTVFSLAIIQSFKTLFRGSGVSRAVNAVKFFIFGWVMLGFVQLPISFLPILDGVDLSRYHLAFIIAFLIALNVIFYILMGAPTQLGRKVMDEIEGMKIYIDLAEKDRLRQVSGPKMSHTHFEKIIPFAIALGVEKNWSSAFTNWLERSQISDHSRNGPSWFNGGIYTGSGISNGITSMGSGLASSMASSMPAPKSSSSGFSGGGSGGGGGGGGGGGW